MLPFLADITLSIYFGASQTRPSDLHVVQAARGNDATIHSVVWRGYSLRAPIYYGVRVTYSSPNQPWTRIALDFTHLKVYADGDERALQSGTWHGGAISEVAPIQDRVQHFEITHGVNLLGIAVLAQVSGPAGGGLYVGAGPVIYLPHSENRVDGLPAGDGYEYGGGGFQVLVGAGGCSGATPVYGEVKYSHGDPVVSIADGRAQTRVDAFHELLGIGFRKCAR